MGNAVEAESGGRVAVPDASALALPALTGVGVVVGGRGGGRDRGIPGSHIDFLWAEKGSSVFSVRVRVVVMVMDSVGKNFGRRHVLPSCSPQP